MTKMPEAGASLNPMLTNAAIMRLATVAELLLIAATWRLWFAASDFPQVLFFGWMPDCPVEVTRSISGAFVCGLIFLGLSGLRTESLPGRIPVLLVLCLGLSAVACNQHCLQPWHWLFLLFAGIRVIVPDVEFPTAVRRIVPWIYVFAAVSRFGPEIDSGMSRWIVATVLDLLDLHMIADQPKYVTLLCITTTLIELIAGLCLLSRRFRRTGMLLAVFMHLTLIVVLGPIGLKQETGVLIWNGYLICLVVQLWRKPLYPPRNSVTTRAMSVFGLVWPTLALFGMTDNWTGWQVYSPRPEVLELQVHVDAISQLSASLRSHVDPPSALEDWSTIRLDRWCLEETGAPLYPQAEFQRIVAREATAHVKNDNHIRARMNRPQFPLWWHRQNDIFHNRSAL